MFADESSAARRWYRKQASRSWPATQATILSGRIETPGRYYAVIAPYSFYAEGNRYGGRYERQFTSESQAQEALKRLRGSSLKVRYKPGNPDTSVLDEG